MSAAPTRYDRAYFDRWYRHPRHRVATRADLDRKVRLVVGLTEYLLGRPVRTVLDVGCGEGRWLAALRRLRAGVRYTGLDPSPYVVERFGRRRNIRPGGFDTLDESGLRGPFDLVVCADVLQYVPTRELSRGLAALAPLVGGVAFLEAYTSADALTGDLRGRFGRSPAYYLRLFRRAGLEPCGMHCYAAREASATLAALERPGAEVG